MLWPFSLITSSRSPLRGTIEAIYGAIVAQARQASFYRDLLVPDTVDGRFDMVVLHLWLVLRVRPRTGDELARGLVDHFCSDMDDNLRELGVGDLTVPKRMVKFGEAFYGRAQAYDAGLAAGAAPDALAIALNRNIYNGVGDDRARLLADYVREAAELLSRTDVANIERGEIHFPHPAAQEQA
jgi:cytochrome b pre-mRNA-processing protein 3